MNEPRYILHDNLERKNDVACAPIKYEVAETYDDLVAAHELEIEAWERKKYGSLESYEKYLPSSRAIVAKEGTQVVGVTRIFAAKEGLLPPSFTELPLYDEEGARTIMDELAATGLIEEVGTAAVRPDVKPMEVARSLWKAAFNDAKSRGVEAWTIIMEPRRVSLMNRRDYMTFEQIGPEVYYQGGMCAVHAMSFESFEMNLQEQDEALHTWLVS